MKKGLLSLLLAAACVFGAFAKQEADPVLMTIDKKQVKLSEFEYLYKKNNAQQTTVQPVDDYLKMFVVYKLKVAEAEKAGIDQTDQFKTELAGYSKDLAEPYLTDDQAREALTQTIYDRLKEEIDVSHIMISLGTDKASNNRQIALLDSLRTEILAGRADFADVADKYSIDPQVGNNHGHMGSMSSLQYPYTFEDAAYNTPVGEISPVTKTQFGYHIIKVNSRQNARGEVRAQHILLLTRGKSPEQVAQQKARIDSIYNLVVAGADFSELAKQYSEDPGSAAKGGQLEWFGPGRMVPEFEQAAYSLKPGEVSQPFATSYGYHIILCNETRPQQLESYEVMAPRIQRVIQRDNRREIPKQEKIRKLSARYNTTIDNKVVKSINDEIAKEGGLSTDLAEKYLSDQRTVVSVDKGKGKATVANLFDKITVGAETITPQNASDMISDAAQQLADETTINYERDNLVNENADYRNLLNEYRDGMLLFEISDREVWSKAKNEPEGLKEYFDNNRSKYTTWNEPKFKGFVVFATSDSIMNAAQTYLNTNNVARNQVVDNLRQKFGKEIKAERVLAAKGENAIIDNIAFGGERPKTNSKWTFYFPYDNSIISQPEEPDDERGTVTADYQNYLEGQWVDYLKSAHKVKVNQKVLTQFKNTIDKE
jgi:peptidyl-prolyl cis-trans isomerase SurA